MAEHKYGAARVLLGEKTKQELIAASKHFDTSTSALAKIAIREWLDKQPEHVKKDPDRFKG